MNGETMILDDIQFLKDLQPMGWSNVTESFEYYLSTQFCFPIKVIVDDKIVGIGSSIIHHDVAWLAHIIVYPDYRNRGIGQFITQILIDKARNIACDTIYLCATELGEIIYRKLGFVTETEYVFFKGIPKNDSPHSNLIIPVKEEMVKQILEMDKKCYGEDRRNSIEKHLLKAYVYEREGGIEGYYLPTLLEGLIVATTDNAGLELMKYRLKTRDDAVFPIDNLIAAELMRHNNLEP